MTPADVARIETGQTALPRIMAPVPAFKLAPHGHLALDEQLRWTLFRRLLETPYSLFDVASRADMKRARVEQFFTGDIGNWSVRVVARLAAALDAHLRFNLVPSPSIDRGRG